MPILPTYQSTAQLQQVQQPNIGRQYGIADIAGAVGQKMTERDVLDAKIEALTTKNQIATAKISAKSQIALYNEEIKSNPEDNPPEVQTERFAKIKDDVSSTIENGFGAFQFQAESQLDFDKGGITGRAEFGKYQIDKNKQLSIAERSAWADDPLRNYAELDRIDARNLADEIHTTTEVTNLRNDSIADAAMVDASSFDVNGDPRFDEIIDKVSNLHDNTYRLEAEQRTALVDKLKKQKKMVMGERADEATGAFVDIMADKMLKNIPLEVDDVMQFKGVIPPKELKGLLKIVKQSQKDIVTEARTGTRYDQSQQSYWRGEGERSKEILDLPQNKELKEQIKKGNIEFENETVSNEIERLQKFDKFNIDRDVVVGRLNADLDKYNYDALVTKLGTDDYLKTLSSNEKEQILNEHNRIITEGQGFRNSKNWQTSFNQLLEFHDGMGFVGGVPDTTDQRVMDKAVLKENREFAQAQKNFLERSEWSFREYKKNPTGDEPNYYQIGEQEIRPFRVQQEEGAVKKFISDIFTLPVTKYMAGKEASIEEQAIQEQTQAFESSPESQQFNQYMAEKEQIAQGAVDSVVGKPETDEFEIGEIRFDHKYVGNGQWQPLNKTQ